MQHSRTFIACIMVMMTTSTVLARQGPGAGPDRDARRFGPAGDLQPDRFETSLFSGSGLCASCHDGLRDESGDDVSLVKEWKPSMMALAFVDPVWKAKVRSETLRIPHLADAIEAKCVRCHAPMASEQARSAGLPERIFGDGFANPDNALHFAAKDGVSCTLCHQIEDSPNLGTGAGYSGEFTIGRYEIPSDRPLFALYQDVFQRSMLGSVDYTPVFGEHIRGSEVCATCHDLDTDYVDAQGSIASTPWSRFPEQAPYREWLEGDYGPDGERTTECLHCHLVQTQETQAARSPRWLPRREDFSRHTFYSENTLMLGIMGRFSDELGIEADGIGDAIESGRAYLLDAASLEIDHTTLAKQTLEFRVKVNNLTGHKLPTSIPVRRVYLHVRVFDSSGELVFESGRLRADHSIEGVDSDSDPSTFEPHYEVITDPSQVQVYQGIMGTVEGDVTYTFLRASHFQKDNRILPAGFDTTTAAESVLPRGICTGDSSFVGGSDEITYRLSGMRDRSYLIDIELLDQSLAYPFVQDLFQDDGDEIVGQFASMYATAPAETELMASAQVEIFR